MRVCGECVFGWAAAGVITAEQHTRNLPHARKSVRRLRFGMIVLSLMGLTVPPGLRSRTGKALEVKK
jgi:hypothetical protein